MNWYRDILTEQRYGSQLSLDTAESSLEYWDKKYPRAGKNVSGLTVMENVDNTGSISASINQYHIYDGIREVPITDFSSGRSYSATENEKSRRLAQEIQRSKSISPLIVVIDREGPYVLEGGHRLYALQLLGIPSFPAMVVLDQDEGHA